MTGSDMVDEAGVASVGRSLIQLVSQLGAAPSAIRVSTGAVSIEVEWPNGSQPVAQTANPAPPPDEQEPDGAELHHITAQTVGAFYTAPAPGQPPFVNIGDIVTPGQQVAILEAMKIMIPVEADCHGRVVEVLPVDSSHVEFGEPLIALAPISP